jgi:hypothetical protein
MIKIAAVSKPGIDATKKVKWNGSNVSEMRNFPNRV